MPRPSHALAALCTAAFAAAATAAPLEMILDRSGGVAAGFDVLPQLQGASFVFGALVAPAGATVTYTYLGAEAGLPNLFGTVGQSFSADSVPGDTLVHRVDEPTLLRFGFGTAEGPNPPDAINGRPQAQFAIFGSGSQPVSTAYGSFQFVLGFDDDAADGDYDDLVVGVSAVPEPTTWALLLAGLGGCALRARRG
jgi:hypothetical protein